MQAQLQVAANRPSIALFDKAQEIIDDDLEHASQLQEANLHLHQTYQSQQESLLSKYEYFTSQVSRIK